MVRATLTDTVDEPSRTIAKPAEMYQVIRVDGRIIFVKSGKDMSRGDEFAENEKLDFKTKESRAAVMSKAGSRKILTPSVSPGKAELLPAMNNVASRSGAMLNAIDLRNHFSGNYLLFERNTFKVNSSAFPMNENQFFYMRYEYQGETIPKKLTYAGDTLVILASELFKVDGKPIEPAAVRNMTLLYRDGSKSSTIAEFNHILPNFNELKEELLIIGIDKSDDVAAYLTEFYGKCSKENLTFWLASLSKR
jgi:hypothetical protein